MLDNAVLFVGPTLAAERALAILPADVRPPAARGDVYRATLDGPRAILLVDGAFEDVAAVFHKEILWALKEGIHVFGASSIGALRAAELHRFGMVGIGEIFEAYRDNRLQRDDAVAVLHGPAELGWPQLTRALEDMVATLGEAERQGVLQPDDRTALGRAAETLFWRERTYAAVVQQAMASGWAGGSAAPFLEWVPKHEISRKEHDCLALLEHVAANWEALEEPFQPSFTFEHTEAWHALQSEVDQSTGMPADAGQIIAALRRDGAFEAIEIEALLAVIAEELVRDADGPADPASFPRAAARFRKRHDLSRVDDVERWMADNRLSHSDYVSLVRDSGNIEMLRNRLAARLPSTVLRLLRARGLIPGL